MALGGRDILKLIVDADAKGAIREFESVGDAADKNLKKVDSGVERVSSGMQKWGAAAAISGGVIAGGLIKAADKFESTALAAGKFSEATGLGVESASRWIAISDDIGVGSDTIQKAFQKMELGLGSNKKVFGDLGIEIAKTSKGTTDLNQTFLNTIDRLQQIEDPTKRALAAQQIFGKGYGEVAELINTSSDKIKTALSSVSDAQVITPAELERAKEYRAAVDNLGDAFSDLVVTIGGGAAPVISTIANTIAGLVNAVEALPPPVKDGAGKVLAFGAAALAAGGSVVFLVGKVASLIDKTHGLSSTLGNVSPKLGAGFAGAAGEIGIAVTAFIAIDEAGNAFLHTAERVKDATDNLAASIGKDGLAKAAQEFQQEAGTNRGLLSGLAEGAQGIAIDFGNLIGVTDQTSESFLNNADDNRAAQAAMKQGLPFFRAYIDGLKQSGQNVDALEAKYKTLVAASANVANAQQQVNSDIQAAADGTAAAGGAVDNFVSKLQNVQGNAGQVAKQLEAMGQNSFEQRAAGMGAAIDATNKRLSEQNQLLQENINKVLEAAGSALGVSAAQRSFNEAVKEANEVQKDGKATADDRAAAYDRETQAAMDTAAATVNYAEKQAEAAGKTLTAKEKNDILIGTLYSLAGQMNGPSKDAIVGLIGQLQTLGAQHPTPTTGLNDQTTGKLTPIQSALSSIQKSYTATVDVNTSDANAKLTALRNRLNSAAGAGVLLIGTGQHLTFARGGMVPGSRNQPQLATVHGGEYVLPTGVVESIRRGRPPGPTVMPKSGGGTGSGVVIQLNGTFLGTRREVGRWVDEALAEARRAGNRAA